MTTSENLDPRPRKPLRLLPGAIAIVLCWLFWAVVPLVMPEWGMQSILGMVIFALITLVWWLFFSRAPWLERLGAIAVMVIAVYVTSFFVHVSVQNGHMENMWWIFSIPLVLLGLVVSLYAARNLSSGMRRAIVTAGIVLAAASMTLIRTGGISGMGDADLHWRWTPTPEERLLAEAGPVSAPPPAVSPTTPQPSLNAAPSAPAEAATPAAAPAPKEEAATEPLKTSEPVVTAAWPGFRGRDRDSVVRGVQIATDWSQTPPVEVWRRAIGPAWSSFAISGDAAYTQEQRGNDEVVSAYHLKTGEPLWMHGDPIRFYESNGGPGPRATPTFHNGRLYTMGATGFLNVLNARDGSRVWSINVATDLERQVIEWGVTSSPLVIDDLVIVAVSGKLAAYDANTGKRRWVGAGPGTGYSSPHLMTIHGVPQVVLLRGSRSTSFAVADGTLLWEHVAEPSASIVQPAILPDGDVLLSTADAMGGIAMRRVTAKPGPSGWTLEERWTSRGLKPYFNDFVVHKGHAYGFDGSILSAIDLATGDRKWKGGRYGMGQMLLLADQDLLLVLAEDGDIALVAATPDKFTEIARVKAIEGKTWNHPVLVGDLLLVRNGEEMAAFRLPRARALTEMR